MAQNIHEFSGDKPIYIFAERLVPATRPKESSRAESKVQRRPSSTIPSEQASVMCSKSSNPASCPLLKPSRVGGLEEGRGYTMDDLGPCVLKLLLNLLHQ